MTEHVEDPLIPLSRKEQKKREKQKRKEYLENAGRVSYGPLPKNIVESYSWMRGLDSFKTEDSGKYTITIKGKALTNDVVSKNHRRYVEEELIKSARTLISAPVTVNHDPTKIVGNVIWSEYEDGALEYLAKINRAPYVELLRNKSSEIRGVSVEADFLWNVCALCGERFYSEEAFQHHMVHEEFVKDFDREPHGIRFKALSLVLAPEEKGVPTATIELVEKVSGAMKLFETIIKDRGESMKEKLKLGEPKDEHGCEPDETWDENQQKCIKKVEGEATEQDVAKDSRGCVVGEEVWSEAENKCVPLSDDDKAKLAPLLDTMKKQGAVQENRSLKEQLQEITERWNEIDEAYVEWKQTMNQKVFENHKKILQTLNEIKAKLENPPKSLEETLGLKDALDKAIIRIDNLEAARKGQFKGHQKPVKETAREHVEDPLKQTS